jgi:hypothetical protein
VFHREDVSTHSFIARPSSLGFHRKCLIARIKITKCPKFVPILVYFEKFYVGKLVRGTKLMLSSIQLKNEMLYTESNHIKIFLR